MNYNEPLPKLEELGRLSQEVGRFPIATRKIVSIARELDYSEEVINLLKLFRGEFESRADLYARTSELALLISEERKQPKEGVLSQQD
ncbi:MAG TPA: hypothetical protein VFX86_02610 [Candidatus Saccharimonadales bacterium]|nr:hypothetical protein [Candidatus Saccharimonadales bacterium]